MTLQGRRRPDTPFDTLPDDIQAGDYWKVLDIDGHMPWNVNEPTNLTKTVWMVVAPFPDGSYGIGTLTRHTVREHEDGTISVLPNDGSSNSILITKNPDQQYHGYIHNGIWD